MGDGDPDGEPVVQRARALAAAVGLPLLIFVLLVGPSVQALEPAAPAVTPEPGAPSSSPPALGIDWWWAVLAPLGAFLLVLLLRGRGRLARPPVPGGVLVALAYVGVFLALVVQLLFVTLCHGLGIRLGATAQLICYTAGWGSAALLCARALSPSPAMDRRWIAPFAIAVWALVFPATVVCSVANVWLLRQAGLAAPSQPVLRDFLGSNPVEGAVFVLMIVGVAPIFEEVVVRGILYRGLRETAGVAAAIVGSALVFTAVHQAAPQAIPIFLLGCVLAWVYERSGTLLAPIALHGVFNGMSLLLAVATH